MAEPRLPRIGFGDIDRLLKWSDITDAIRAGHRLPRASIDDGLVFRGDDALLTRAAWIDGLGSAVKSATIVPGNAARGLSTVHGGVTLFSDATGEPEAILDFHLVTKWKTAADSLLGAETLARRDSRRILVMGAGTVARNLVHAYGSAFANAAFRIWNRSPKSAQLVADELAAFADITVAGDREAAVRWADIVCCATMASDPILHGDWLQPGQHVDLIGSFRPDMREADDAALRRARIFVDSHETTRGHTGEIRIPLETGAISEEDILGDFYGLLDGLQGRVADDDITLFKNGGGAHLDLMTARRILEIWTEEHRADHAE